MFRLIGWIRMFDGKTSKLSQCTNEQVQVVVLREINDFMIIDIRQDLLKLHKAI